MFKQITFVSLLCATTFVSAMGTESDDPIGARAMARNLTFTDPAGAQAAVPTGHWHTRDQKDLVVAICQRMVDLARTTATSSDIVQYCGLALTLQHRMVAELDETSARELVRNRSRLIARWRELTLPTAHNNVRSRAQRSIDFSGDPDDSASLS